MNGLPPLPALSLAGDVTKGLNLSFYCPVAAYAFCPPGWKMSSLLATKKGGFSKLTVQTYTYYGTLMESGVMIPFSNYCV